MTITPGSQQTETSSSRPSPMLDEEPEGFTCIIDIIIWHFILFHLVSSCLNPLLSRFIVFRFRMAMTPKPGVHSVPRPPAWSLSDLGVTCCEESARPNVVPMTHRSPVTHLYPLGDLGDPLSLTAQNITMPYPDLIPDGSRWSDGTEWYISNY